MDDLDSKRQHLLTISHNKRVYYQKQEAKYRKIRTWLKAASLIASFFALNNFLISPEFANDRILVAVFLNIISLIGDFGSKAIESAKRGVEWSIMEREILRLGSSYDNEDINRWSARVVELEIKDHNQVEIFKSKE